MGCFDWFKREKRPGRDEIRESVDAFQKLWDTPIGDIWGISDTDSFLIAMNGWICKKCGYGGAMEALTAQERVVYCTVQLQAEVENGGFWQYFYNGCGAVGDDLAAAFEAIGARETADICRRAVAAFGRVLPPDRERREALLDGLADGETDRISRILSECDGAFLGEPEQLPTLIYRYIMENRSCFG